MAAHCSRNHSQPGGIHIFFIQWFNETARAIAKPNSRRSLDAVQVGGITAANNLRLFRCAKCTVLRAFPPPLTATVVTPTAVDAVQAAP